MSIEQVVQVPADLPVITVVGVAVLAAARAGLAVVLARGGPGERSSRPASSSA